MAENALGLAARWTKAGNCRAAPRMFAHARRGRIGIGAIGGARVQHYYRILHAFDESQRSGSFERDAIGGGGKVKS